MLHNSIKICCSLVLLAVFSLTPASVYALSFPTYNNIDELQSKAVNVIKGSVESSSISQAPPTKRFLGTSKHYLILVNKVFKGNSSLKSKTITVSVALGNPNIKEGATHIFFLSEGENGIYYPLAADNAIALQQQDGSYVLNSEVTGDKELRFTENDLTGSNSNYEVVKILLGVFAIIFSVVILVLIKRFSINKKILKKKR